MKPVRKVLVFAFFISYFLSHPRFVHASKEFTTSYDVTYEAGLSGKLKVVQNISLTNKLSDVYVTSYSLKIERGKVENIYAFDSQGAAKTVVEVKDEGLTIKIDFNDQIVGFGKTLKFTLGYESSDLIKRSGNIWELTVPKLNNPEDIDEYNLTLRVPLSFGEPAFISPSPQSQKKEGETQSFFFTKNDLISSGIIAAFGEFQIFDFSLNYHLENPQNVENFQKIALPPDTAYQKVSYWEVSPQPENVEVDQDGNWLAVFKLKPKENLLVTASGQVKMFALPLLREPNGKINPLDFLEPKPYWETDNPEIAKLGKKLKTPRAIHDFVASTLEYDYSRARIGAKRLGAAEALSQPGRAICTEYTDLFIALARAAGIPAREINGYAFTTNPQLRPLSLAQDILHSWPEYWDKEKNTWIQIDPTWQDTTGGINYFDKLDLGHFAFVIHGKESTLPLPAGAYKEAGSSQKDVQVTFGRLKEAKNVPPTIEFLLPSTIYSEKPSDGTLLVKNQSPEAIPNLSLALSGTNLKVQGQTEYHFDLLPPFSKRTISLRVSSEKIFYHGQGRLTAFVNERKLEYNLTVNSFVLSYCLPALGGILASTALFIITRKVRRLYLQRR